MSGPSARSAGGWEVGQPLPPHEFVVTRPDVARYAAVSGDAGRIHLSDAAARAAGLPGLVAHGMLTLALASRAVEGWAGGPERVRGMTARFTSPVVVPDNETGTVVVVGGVVRLVESGLVTVSLDVTAGIDKVLSRARASFLLDG